MNALTLKMQLELARIPYWIEIIDENRWEIIGVSLVLWGLAEGLHYFRTRKKGKR